MPDGPFFDGAWLSSQSANSFVAAIAARIACLQLRARLRNATIELFEVLRLLPHRAGARHPQVVRVTGEVAAGLRQERRYAVQLGSEAGLRRRVEGERIRP